MLKIYLLDLILSFVIIEVENFLRRKEGVIKALRNRGFDVEEGGHAATRMLGRNISVETVQRVYNEGRCYYDATNKTWIRVKGNVAVVTKGKIVESSKLCL